LTFGRVVRERDRTGKFAARPERTTEAVRNGIRLAIWPDRASLAHYQIDPKLLGAPVKDARYGGYGSTAEMRNSNHLMAAVTIKVIVRLLIPSCRLAIRELGGFR
jgi:hypothetical protein